MYAWLCWKLTYYYYRLHVQIYTHNVYIVISHNIIPYFHSHYYRLVSKSAFLLVPSNSFSMAIALTHPIYSLDKLVGHILIDIYRGAMLVWINAQYPTCIGPVIEHHLPLPSIQSWSSKHMNYVLTGIACANNKGAMSNTEIYCGNNEQNICVPYIEIESTLLNAII